MLYGHARSIARGSDHMRHNTGFTEARLGLLLLECGFHEARTIKGPGYDLWALALMSEADGAAIIERCRSAGLNFSPG